MPVVPPLSLVQRYHRLSCTDLFTDFPQEHHLQAVIHASAAAAKGLAGGKIAQLFIPTPDAVKSDVPYDSLYPRGAFAQPATYIRFSSTVEECTGISYCMDERDDEMLRSINEQAAEAREKTSPCGEDQFELVMNAFEETSLARQPFANVDGTPVLAFEELEAAFDDNIDEVARAYASEIYNWWKERKIERGHGSIMPRPKTLNMDRAQEYDDSDPYVCFRRREVRLARKTRGRDAQIIEKLKRLRRELEEGRQLLHWVKNREEGRKEDLRLSRQIYDQRAAVREMKRTLNITDDDEELLINQRTPKRKPAEIAQQIRQAPQTLRRQDSVMTLPDFDVVNYRDKLELREKETMAIIQRKLKEYEAMNTQFMDRTQDFLQGVWAPQDEFEDEPMSQWVSVQVKDVPHFPQQQPTPPASVVDESSNDEDRVKNETIIRWATPPDSQPSSPERRVFVRQRRGRGGRLMLDRRILRGRQQMMYDSKTAELFKYDHESGDEDDDDGHDHLDVTNVKWFRLREHLSNVQKAQRAAGGHGRGPSNAGRPAAQPSLASSRVQMT